MAAPSILFLRNGVYFRQKHMSFPAPQNVAAQRPILRIAFWQLIAFLVLISAVWLNEALDGPALLFGLPAKAPDWDRAAILTAAVCVALLIAVIPLYIHKRNALRESITICSYCRRVQDEAKSWAHVEAFFTNRAYTTVSHGVCPECSAKVMHDYRAGRKDAGARETVVNELFV
jgi:hypothetical protein